jgi:type IV pilus assembly protein PilB
VRLGELAVALELITNDQLQEALQHQKQHGGKIGHNLLNLGFVKDEELVTLLSARYGVPSVNLPRLTVDRAVTRLIPEEIARKYQILPLSRSGATLTIAMANPTDIAAMEDIVAMTGCTVALVVASETSIMAAIDQYYSRHV